MRIFTQILIAVLLFIADICCECDKCQGSNFVACHEENVYSLCVNGSATNNFITCPESHVCTPDKYVCYPIAEAKPSCERERNLCGVCSENKAYACINETTIAFCYGADKPVEGAEVAHCSEGTVCDIYSEKGFCTESYLVKPTCVTSENKTIDTTTRTSIVTAENSASDSTTTTTPFAIATTSAERVTEQPITTAAAFTITEPTKIVTVKPTPGITDLSTAPQTTELSSHTTTTTSKPATKQPTTTVSTPTDPNEICKLHAKNGSFAAADPTCKTFIVCFASQGSMAGIKKSCKAGQYFPPGATYCSSEKPDICK